MARQTANGRMALLVSCADMAQEVVSELSDQHLIAKSPDVEATVKLRHEGGKLSAKKLGRQQYEEMTLQATTVTDNSAFARELGGAVEGNPAVVTELPEQVSQAAGTSQATASQPAGTSQAPATQALVRRALRRPLDISTSPLTCWHVPTSSYP